MFKQLLMVAGFDRYFQIAPCFRDEDARADRSPGEFYQLDFEMSFVTQDDVFAAIEPVLSGVFDEFGKGKYVTPAGEYPRIPYKEALLKYGSDKPDLGIRCWSVTSASISRLRLRPVRRAGREGLGGPAVPAPKTADKSRKFFDDMNEWARSEGSQASAMPRARAASGAADRQERGTEGMDRLAEAMGLGRMTASSSPPARKTSRQARRPRPHPRR